MRKIMNQMISIKRWILSGIWLIFTIFLSIKYLLARAFLLLFGKLPLKITETLRRSIFLVCQKSTIKRSNNGWEGQQQIIQMQLSQCLQSVIDSALSLCLTASLVNYNQALVKFTLLISHQVHRAFLSIISDEIPNYTSQIEQQYSYFLIWVFIVLGFLGFSFQIALVIDLINIFTLPTKVIYGILRVVYKNSIWGIRKAYEFMNTDERKWITCPYPVKLITPNFRTSAFGILIILIHITVFTSFYYIWLAFVIVVLNILQNSLINIFTLWINLLRFISQLKQSKIIHQKIDPVSGYLTIFEPETALRIFQGIDINENKSNTISYYKDYCYHFKISLLFGSFIKTQKSNR